MLFATASLPIAVRQTGCDSRTRAARAPLTTAGSLLLPTVSSATWRDANNSASYVQDMHASVPIWMTVNHSVQGNFIDVFDAMCNSLRGPGPSNKENPGPLMDRPQQPPFAMQGECMECMVHACSWEVGTSNDFGSQATHIFSGELHRLPLGDVQRQRCSPLPARNASQNRQTPCMSAQTRDISNPNAFSSLKWEVTLVV